MSETEPLQQANAGFFLPVAVAYLAVCATWFVTRLATGTRWELDPPVETEARWLDLLMVPLAILGIFALGEAYRRGWLLPAAEGAVGSVLTAINLLIPFLPIFLVLAIRRQSLATVWLSARAVHWKLLVGCLSAVFGVTLFLALRGELGRFSIVLGSVGAPRNLIHAPAVFMEAVAVAFLFVRLRWVFGPWLSLLVPCLLFAAAHVPGSLQDGRPAGEVALFFLFNTGLPLVIFATVMRSRDVIWIAIPHYVIDIAIEAFG